MLNIQYAITIRLETKALLIGKPWFLLFGFKESNTLALISRHSSDQCLFVKIKQEMSEKCNG